MRTLIFLTSLVMLITCVIGCDDDDPGMMPELTESYRDIDRVTGLYLYDENGNPLGRWRSPNEKPVNNAFAFPNPSVGQVAFFSNTQFDKIWLVPAECLIDSVTFDIPGRVENIDYPVEDVESAAVSEFDITDGQLQIILNFENVEPGFYRLFYAENGSLPSWQNLFIDPTVNNIPSLDVLDEACE